MSYKKGILGDYIDILSGFAFKTKDFNYCGVPVIKIKNICPPYVCLNDLSYVTTELADKQNKFELKFNDVLIAMTGSHINRWESSVGRVARVRFRNRALLNQRVGKVVAKPDVDVCIDYIYYFLSQDKIRTELASKATGSANQANISPTHIKEIILDYVNVETQIKISHILSAYDNLIENNQKQIKLLEEVAQRLYKEWFIDLRFPGHENVEIVDGVPEGWYIDRADHYFKITIGKTPSRAEKQWFTNSGEGTPWISISDMGESGAFAFYSKEDLTADAIIRHNMKVVPKGTILVSFKLTVGRVAITSIDMCTNEAIAHFHIDNDLDRAYTYCYLKNFEYDSLGNTSSISKAINSKIIKNMPFIMPSEDILGQFSMIVQPILNQIELKQKIIFRLTEARDRLLPKLMSGEIEV